MAIESGKSERSNRTFEIHRTCRFPIFSKLPDFLEIPRSRFTFKAYISRLRSSKLLILTISSLATESGKSDRSKRTLEIHRTCGFPIFSKLPDFLKISPCCFTFKNFDFRCEAPDCYGWVKNSRLAGAKDSALVYQVANPDFAFRAKIRPLRAGGPGGPESLSQLPKRPALEGLRPSR